MKLSMAELLRKLIELKGSDLHLQAGSPPRIRINGRLRCLEGHSILTDQDTKQLIYYILTDAQKAKFERELELDCPLEIKGLSRFRINVYNHHNTVGAVARAIPHRIPKFDSLGLPNVVAKLCDKPKGLILVTGPTGSGKSTTLASMIDLINETREEHILTIEEPLEFIHENKGCLVTQREVGADTTSFAEGGKRSLRQDPDVVLIGEMRDLETMVEALRIAETGHLTLATLHTNSAASTMNRIIDAFPEGQQAQIRAQLSLVLEGVLSQTLLERADGQGRVMALEILIPTSAIRNLIRENKVHQIYSMMQSGQDTNGMQTFNQSLAELHRKGLITKELAYQRSHNLDELRELIERAPGAGTLNFATTGRAHGTQQPGVRA